MFSFTQDILSQNNEQELKEAREIIANNESSAELKIMAILTLNENTTNWQTLALGHYELSQLFALEMQSPLIAAWHMNKSGFAAMSAATSMGYDYTLGTEFIVDRFTSEGYMYQLYGLNVKACRSYKLAIQIADGTIGSDEPVQIESKTKAWYMQNCKEN